jgi:hypothetical protein
MKEKRIYPPTVFRGSVEVAYDIYEEAVRTRKVGDFLVHSAGAPGVGHVKYQITRIDSTGVYGIEVENTIWIPDGDYYR